MPESLITKQAIANGLKQIMKNKPFAKVSVTDITAACGLNRQTFYYHFHDKYDLLNWIFCNEVLVVLTTDLTVDTWPRNLKRLLCALSEQKGFYKNALKYSFQDEFHEYLFRISSSLIYTIITHMDADRKIAEEDKQFLARFFSFGVVGSIISWVTEGMNKPPEEMIEIIITLVNACKAYAVKQYIK